MAFFQTFSYRLIIIVLVSEPEVRPLDEVDVFEDLVQQILPGRFSLKMFSFSKIFLWRKHSLMWLGIWYISSEECVLNKSIKIRQIKRRYFCCCRHTIADSLALVGFREKKNQKNLLADISDFPNWSRAIWSQHPSPSHHPGVHKVPRLINGEFLGFPDCVRMRGVASLEQPHGAMATWMFRDTYGISRFSIRTL